MTADAQPVLDTDGRPITIARNNGHDRRPTGVVIGRRQARSPSWRSPRSTPRRLHKLGDNLVHRAPSRRTPPAGRVEQGYLENSNVNSVEEMVDLIATMRTFEAGQKAVQALDDTLGKAVNEVGRIS